MRQRGLADAGNVLEEQVSVGAEGGQRKLDDLGLAAQGAGDVRLQRPGEAEGLLGRQRLRLFGGNFAGKSLQRGGNVGGNHSLAA